MGNIYRINVIVVTLVMLRGVFYLIYTTSITSGSGTQDDPYLVS